MNTDMNQFLILRKYLTNTLVAFPEAVVTTWFTTSSHYFIGELIINW